MVDEWMQTNCPGIYAAGDVAQATDLLWGRPKINAIWPNATEQGWIAGLNMAGVPTRYSGSMPMNAVDFYGLSVMAAGLTKVCPEEGYEVSVYRPGRGVYRKLVFKEDRLVGYIMVGDTAKAGLLTALLKEQTPLAGEKENLQKGFFRQKILWG